MDVLDREDTETERHMFELAPREQSKIVFKVGQAVTFRVRNTFLV